MKISPDNFFHNFVIFFKFCLEKNFHWFWNSYSKQRSGGRYFSFLKKIMILVNFFLIAEILCCTVLHLIHISCAIRSSILCKYISWGRAYYTLLSRGVTLYIKYHHNNMSLWHKCIQSTGFFVSQLGINYNKRYMLHSWE